MKRLTLIIALVLLGTVAFAQTVPSYETEHYRVRSHISEEHARTTAEQLEALMQLFNQYFQFDLTNLDFKLKVQVFDTQSKFDRYLQRIISETRDEFVYLHYADVARSELAGYLESGDEYDESLTHQAFIQYLRAFIPNPPIWLREGFAVFFEGASFDANFNAAVTRENLAWLETLKEYLFGTKASQSISAEVVLTMDVETARTQIDAFYPMAWGIVNYLINSDTRSHNRLLWDTISRLEANASLEENSQTVLTHAFQFVSRDDLKEQFFNYFQNKKTYRELIQAGIDEYNNGNLGLSEENFVVAISRQDTSYIPYYYLGLINYDRGNYALAELNYNQALEKGSSAALTYYALGVNAFADNRYDEATEFLQTTVQLDPAAFTDKATEILERMEG